MAELDAVKKKIQHEIFPKKKIFSFKEIVKILFFLNKHFWSEFFKCNKC